MSEFHAAGLVLAAGASSRTGTPKALARYGSRSFVEHILTAMRLGGCNSLWLVVGGQHEFAIRRHLVNPAVEGGSMPVNLVSNPQPTLGMWSSLHCGLRALEHSGAAAVVIGLVDHPRVASTTIARLLAAFRETSASRVVPTWRGRGGHPHVLDASLIPRLLNVPSEATTRQALHGLVGCRIEVQDPGVVEDLDTPEAIRGVGGCLSLPLDAR